MGMIYKRTYKRKDGTVGETAVCYIKYYRDGIPMYESTEATKENEAKKLLKLREGDVQRGMPVTPGACSRRRRSCGPCSKHSGNTPMPCNGRVASFAPGCFIVRASRSSRSAASGAPRAKRPGFRV